MAIEDNLSAAGIPYPVAAEILNGLKVGGSTSSGAFVALGVAPPAAEELARQVNARTGSAHLLTNSGFPPEASNQIRNTINGALQIGRPLLSSSRLQVLSARAQVTSADIYKMRIIAETSAPWQEYGKSFAFAAWYGNEQPLGNDWPIKAAMVEIGDKQYPLTVNGQEVFTVPDGTAVWTDELPVVIPANAVIRIGVADELAVGQYRPSQGPVYLPRSVVGTSSNRGDAINTSATVSQVANLKANTGEFFTNTPGVVSFDSLPILSTSRPYGAVANLIASAILSVGDSIEWGDRSQGMPFGITADELGATGFLQRAYNTLPGGRIPFGSMGVPGTRLLDLTLNPTPVGVAIKGFDKRRALLEAKGWPFDVILCEMGLNSATNGNATTVVADAKAAHAQLKTMGGKRVIQTLLLPCSFSKDEGTNADNNFLWSSADASKQVRQASSSIDAFNNYIIGTPTDVDGYIELASVIESSLGSGKFGFVRGQQGRITADAASGQKNVTVNFLVQPGDAIILNPGDSAQVEAKDIQAVVDNGNGTWALTFRQNLTRAHTANADTSVITAAGVYTFDGIHMVTQAARRLKERVRSNAALLDPRATRNQRKLVNAVMGGLICNNVLPISGTKTRFKGRRAFPVGIFSPPFLQPTFCPFWTNGNYAQREVAAAQDVPITKASVVYNNVVVPVTYKGSRSFTIPAGVAEFQCDPIFPADFGVTAFAPRSFVEYRHYFDLTTGQSAPYCDYGTDFNQSWRGVPSDLPDDIDATGSMTATGSPDSLNIFFPSMMVSAFSGAFASLGFLGDSIFRQQNDVGGLGRAGGGYHKRAAYAEGIPFMTMAVGGRTAEQTANSPKLMSLLEAGRFSDLHIGLGSNELAGSRDVGLIIGDDRLIWAAGRRGGVRRIIQSNVIPRTTDNAFKCTDLANQSPVAGFEPGGRRDQFHAALAAEVGVNGGPDTIYDFAAVCSDPTTPSLWRVPTFNGMLTSAVAISATSIQTDTAPSVNDNLVFEPGNASNVDIGGQGGPRVASVTGSANPFTVSFVPSTTNPWNGAADGALGTPAKAHASGTSVKATIGTDGTHPAMAAHVTASDQLKPVYRALIR